MRLTAGWHSVVRFLWIVWFVVQHQAPNALAWNSTCAVHLLIGRTVSPYLDRGIDCANCNVDFLWCILSRAIICIRLDESVSVRLSGTRHSPLSSGDATVKQSGRTVFVFSHLTLILQLFVS